MPKLFDFIALGGITVTVQSRWLVNGATVTEIVTKEGAKRDKIKELQIMRKPA
jgi:hypothetical protein